VNPRAPFTKVSGATPTSRTRPEVLVRRSSVSVDEDSGDSREDCAADDLYRGAVTVHGRYRVYSEPVPPRSMTYYELAFRLQHDCPYLEFSREYPSAVVSHWCNWSRDVLEIYGPVGDRQARERSICSLLRRLGSKLLRVSDVPPNLRVVLQHCGCDRLPPPTLPVLERRNCLNLQPMVYANGWEHYRVAVFSQADISRLTEDLGRSARIEVMSRRSVRAAGIHTNLLVPVGTLLGDLTKRQIHALVTGLDSGYYRFPRGASATEIARRLGTPRVSFMDHLRKAENKVINAVGAYARMGLGSDPPKHG
jgi:predicted DNA binding protein